MNLRPQTNPTAARYDRPSELPAPPTSCAEYDEAHRLLTEARSKRHATREQLSEVERLIRKADESHALDAAEDILAGKEPRKDPREALSKRREKLVLQESVEREVQNRRADELDAVLDPHRVAWLEREDARRKELAAVAADKLESFVETTDAMHEVTALMSWIKDGRLKGAHVGAREVNALRKAIGEVVSPTPTYHVRQPGYDALRRGDSTTDALTGEKVTRDMAERGVVKIVHGPPRHVPGVEFD